MYQKDFTAILAHALDRLQILQSNITQMHLFFTEINCFVEVLVTNTNHIELLVSREKLEARRSELDAYLRGMIRGSSLDIKPRFIAMHKTAQAFADVPAKS